MSNNAVNLVRTDWRCKDTTDSDAANGLFSCCPKNRPKFQRLSEKPSDIALLALKNALKNILTIFFRLNAQKRMWQLATANYHTTISQLSIKYQTPIRDCCSTASLPCAGSSWGLYMIEFDYPLVVLVSSIFLYNWFPHPSDFGAKRLQGYKKHSNILSSMKLIKLKRVKRVSIPLCTIQSSLQLKVMWPISVTDICSSTRFALSIGVELYCGDDVYT